MKTLRINNLHAQTTDGKAILKGVDLAVRQHEIHVIMGSNGGGKSTLAQVLAGHPGYTITHGSIKIGRVNLTSLLPEQRAMQGLFLGFQYPVEVAGVNYAQFVRMAINNKAEKKLTPITFRKQLTETAKRLAMNQDLTKRMLNEGFSGGEKKKLEIIQMALLQPEFVVLDEPDSGLDVDALKYIAQEIQNIHQPVGLIIITHYQRILQYIKPDFVHILLDGRIVKSGSYTLAEQVEQQGYEQFSTN